MKKRLHRRLWIWIVVSLLAHLFLLRTVEIQREPVLEKYVHYEVKLLYLEPRDDQLEAPIPAEAKKSKPRKIVEKSDIETFVEEPVEQEAEAVGEDQAREVKQTEETHVSEKTYEDTEKPMVSALVVENELPKPPDTSEPEQQKPLDVTPVIEGLRRRIEEELVYPYIARKKGLQGVVRLTLRLDENGNLIEVVVVQSSGYKVLDSAAVALIEKVVPYRHDLRTSISVDIPIRYSLLN
jgi:protein TonB